MDMIEKFRERTEPLRTQLLLHPVYASVDSLHGLQIFMETHVFAVWDFMSLLKRLQQLQTCIDTPWLPPRNRLAARFINEIVLGEESDVDSNGTFISHFELYHRAMQQCGASVELMDNFLLSVAKTGISAALESPSIPPHVRDFVQTTWSFITSDKPHCIAASFAFGREDIIPEMFRRCMDHLQSENAEKLQALRYYLDRHIELDADSHGPMAAQIMRGLCGESSQLWDEAADAVNVALQARLLLWDGVLRILGTENAET